MKAKLLKLYSVTMLLVLVSGCARDLSSSMYTSDTTLSLTMEGVIVASRAVNIKNTDKLENNSLGMLGGAALGGVAGSGVGGGTGKGAAIVSGAIIGSMAGAVIQDKLSENKGYEYIVKVDTSKIKDSYFEGNAAMRNVIATAKLNGLITVVQGKDTVLNPGQNVYVIFSDNRTRVIPAN